MNQEKIGKLIAKLRKSKGLTQSELGEMVGVGFRAVSKWENGITIPDISIINDLSKILGISADELLKGELNNSSKTKSKFNYKNIIYFIPIILVIALSIIIININKNKTEVYKLGVIDNSDYYVEGEIIFRGNDMVLNINKISFINKKIKNTIIKNYQYEIYSKKSLIVGCGYTATDTRFLDSPTSINLLFDTLKINYISKTVNNKREIIDDGLNLKFGFIDEYDKEIIKDIKIILLKQK